MPTERFLRADRMDIVVLFYLMTAGVFFSPVIIQAAAALLFLLWMVNPPRVSAMAPFDMLMLLFLISGVLALWISGLGLAGVRHVMPHLILFAAVPLRRWHPGFGGGRLLFWCKVVCLAATAIALVGVGKHLMGAVRTEGLHGGYFTLAGTLAWSIPLSLALVFTVERGWRYMAFAAIVIQFAALWWTFTRSAFLALLIALFLGFGTALAGRWFRQPRKPRLSAGGIAAIGIPLLLLLLIFQSGDPRINPWAAGRAGAPAPAADITSGRLAIIGDAVNQLTQDWRGGNYRQLMTGYGSDSRKRLVGNQFGSWESDYLQVLMNQGVLGVMLLLAIYGIFGKWMVHGLLSRQWLLVGIASGSLGYLVMSFLTLKVSGFASAGDFVCLALLLSHCSDRRGD